MHRFALGLCALAFAFCGTSRADDDRELRAVLAKAVEARGGAANIAKYTGVSSKFKGKFRGNGMEIDLEGTFQFQAPNKVRNEMVMQVAGSKIDFLQVVDGTKGWFIVANMPMDMNKEMLEESREEFHARTISDLRGLDAKGVKLSAMGESKVEGKDAVGIRVSQEGYRDVSLFFDKSTLVLLKSESRVKDVQGGGEEYTSETFLSDYKKVGGVTVPYKIKVLRDGKPFLDMETIELTQSEKLDDNLFKKP